MTDTSTPNLRIATAADTSACFDVFWASVTDLARRLGTPWEAQPAAVWARLEPTYEHLATHAAEWWIAEDAASGAPIGYARSVERGGLFELSEFFVDPGRQSGGVGAALLERAFPAGRGEVRAIIATTDVRAQARYYAAGTAARFPIVSLEGAPRPVELDPGLTVERAGTDQIGELSAIEAAVLEFDRGEEFRWLLDTREGYLYRRDGRPVGFAFINAQYLGPIAAHEPADQPAILAHVEARGAELGADAIIFEVPTVNEVAIRHLLQRGFRIDPFYTFLMSNRPFGHFDRFIGFAPPFIL
jgi:GNAT superfamily N-acetyltransferase